MAPARWPTAPCVKPSHRRMGSSAWIRSLSPFRVPARTSSRPHLPSRRSSIQRVIDGTSEPGFTDCASGVMIELDGSGAGTGAGLNVTAGGTTIRGLAVNGFDAAQLQAGIRLATGGGNAVECSLIGTDASGTTALPNSIGILVASSAANRIGGPGVGNVISGNSFIGLDVEGSPAGTSNVVQGNLVGLNITGTGGSRKRWLGSRPVHAIEYGWRTAGRRGQRYLGQRHRRPEPAVRREHRHRKSDRNQWGRHDGGA